MIIEEKHYTHYKEMLDEMNREIEEKKAKMTPEEIAADHKKMMQQAEWIKQQSDEKASRQKKVVNPKKVENYEEMKKFSLALARQFDFDIQIEEKNEFYATIELVTGDVILNDYTPKEGRCVLALLITSADDVYIGAKGEDIYFSFGFNLYNIVEIVS
jgi:myo-inositol-1-phosphate synthase